MKISNVLLCYFKVSLAPMFPSTLMVGMEIRVKVSDYVMDKIKSLRSDENSSQIPGQYQNIACIRTNAMKYLPNFFKKAQVSIFNFVSVFNQKFK